MDEKKKKPDAATEVNPGADAAQPETAQAQTDAQSGQPGSQTDNETASQTGNGADTTPPDAGNTPDPAATDAPADTPASESPAPDTVSPAGDVAARVDWLTAQLLSAKATAAATALGIPPERAKYALRLADLSQIDVTAADADKRISAAMGQVVKDLPELTTRPGQTTGTPGMFARQNAAPLTPFERGLNGN